MSAHDVDRYGDLPTSERPTMPAPPPRESGVQLRVERRSYGCATVDVVVCDLSRDARCEAVANDHDEAVPPSRSNVEALR